MIKEKLFELKDDNYKEFHKKLIPNIDESLIIGVRTPELRKLAKEFFANEKRDEFLKALPHTYYEENNLHAFLIEQFKDYDRVIYETERFLPFIDNWATCDMFRPKIYKKHTDKLIVKIEKWINSDNTYTVRYGIGLLLSYYLDEHFLSDYLEKVSEIKSDEYYVNMMIAWYFQAALVKQYDYAIKYIEDKRLDKWVHNKAISKVSDSLKISKEKKDYIKSLKY